MIRNSFIGLSFGGGGTNARYFRNSNTAAETQGGVIRNNVIEDTADVGIYMHQARDFEIIDNTVVRGGKNTGSIAIRYSQSRGDVHDNRTTGKIRLRDGASADLDGNTRVSADTPGPG